MRISNATRATRRSPQTSRQSYAQASVCVCSHMGNLCNHCTLQFQQQRDEQHGVRAVLCSQRPWGLRKCPNLQRQPVSAMPIHLIIPWRKPAGSSIDQPAQQKRATIMFDGREKSRVSLRGRTDARCFNSCTAGARLGTHLARPTLKVQKPRVAIRPTV